MAKSFDLKKFQVQKPNANPVIEEQAVAAIHTPPPSVTQQAKTEKEGSTRITVETPNGLYLKLKTKAVGRKLTLRAYILELIEKEVADI